MSGVTGNNPYRASGVVAAAGAGGLSWQDIVTASTLTAEAGNAYWINTTSNACTITLPASASNGDEIMFADYDRTWGTNGIIIDSNGLNYQGEDDTFDVEYDTDGTALHIVYSGATNGWIPTLDKTVEEVPSKGNKNGIFGFGYVSDSVSMTNIVSTAGVIATDVSGVGTARYGLGACEYGGDKGIFSFGEPSKTNLVSNAGVVATDVTQVGSARYGISACSYGEDKGIFGFGRTPGTNWDETNLVSSIGVVGTDVTGVGTDRHYQAATEYGGDKGIFGYGTTGTVTAITNLVSNSGVVATDTSGVGSARKYLAACRYGTETSIFAYGDTAPGDGSYVSLSNKVSSSGVVATDVTGVGTARQQLEACEYGDKGIFAYGYTGSNSSLSNLVSNAGVIATDVTAVGTARRNLAACSFN